MSSANSKPLRLLAWRLGLTAILAAILSATIMWLVERGHTGGSGHTIHVQLMAFAHLRQVVIEKMRELRSTIDEQRAGRPDAARAIVNSDRGLKMMDQIRRLVSEVRNEEERVLSNRLSAPERVGTLLQVGAPIPFVLICAVGVLTGLYMRRSLSELTVALQHGEQNQFRLQLAMDAAHLGSWQYDPLHRCGLRGYAL